jgi:hypothetical protein
MFKKVNNWHLSILVLIVSFFSVALIQEYALAAWQEPGSVPGSAANQNIVLNPMTADLDLNNNSLLGTNVIIDPDGTNAVSISNSANLCLTGSCRSTWPADPSDPVWNEHAGGIDYVNPLNPKVGIGTAVPDELLHIEGGNLLVSNGNINMADDVSLKALYGKSYASILFLDSKIYSLNLAGDDINFKDLSGNDLVFIDDIGTIANLGIGTNSPNKSLHIKTPTKINAEINLESGTNTHWGMYQDETTADLRFWYNDDNIVFDSLGYLGVGTSNPNHQLHVESVTQNAVYGETEAVGKYGVYGEHTSGGGGVFGSGQTGLSGVSIEAGGTGIMGVQGIGDYAGTFWGDLRLYNVGAKNSYLHLATTDIDPPDTDCDSTDERGRMIFNYADDQLFICDYDPIDPGGGGWKYPDIIETP